MRKRAVMLTLTAGLVLASGCEPRDPGARVYGRKCAGCHGKDGAGEAAYRRARPAVILTDAHWKHGSDLESIRKVIREGSPNTPMPAFSGKLTDQEIEAVASHVSHLVVGKGR